MLHITSILFSGLLGNHNGNEYEEEFRNKKVVWLRKVGMSKD
jgi:hypothetical protein